ncbi:hypothetical protein BD779DRAFT_1673650 [Infundibulicybe gibba]|nr:hypothetical protein BD779DRAFT_1673650 [Infundibulicybe gibba]
MDPVTSARGPCSAPHPQSKWRSTLVDLSDRFIRLLFYRPLARLFRDRSSTLDGAEYVGKLDKSRIQVAGTPQLAGFDAKFPPELVERILAKLDCRDILTVRRKNFCHLQDEVRLEECHSALPRHAPMVAETRGTAACLFRLGIGAMARPGEVNNIFLIPGGRWLLAGPIDGVVTVYDLDTPEMKSKTLISLVDEKYSRRGCCMAISVNDKSPVLTFDIVLATQPFYASVNRLSIWRATLSGHGPGAELTAHYVTCFDFPSFDISAVLPPQIVALDGEYIAQVKDDTIEILKWTESTSSTRMMAVIFCEEQPEWICILPGARILSFSHFDMFVYQIPPLELVPASSDPDFLACTPHTWRVSCRSYDLEISGISISPIWADGDITSFNVYTRNGVQAVTIPAAPCQPPSFTKLDLPRLCDHQIGFCLGRYNSIIRSVSSVTVLTHGGDRETTSQSWSIGGHQVFFGIRSYLDEASARLVLITRSEPIGAVYQDMFLVLDFANIHTP